jgi:hypothetical protein
MNKKAKRYENGGEIEFETAQGPNKNISDDIREKAMKSVAEGGQKSAPKAAPKVVSKTYSKPQPESDREENSDWMRQFRKDEAAAKKSSFAGKTSAFADKPSAFKANSEKTGFQLKKEKALGMKMGGKVSSASSRGDGCATKGKTKGRFV